MRYRHFQKLKLTTFHSLQCNQAKPFPDLSFNFTSRSLLPTQHTISAVDSNLTVPIFMLFPNGRLAVAHTFLHRYLIQAIVAALVVYGGQVALARLSTGFTSFRATRFVALERLDVIVRRRFSIYLKTH